MDDDDDISHDGIFRPFTSLSSTIPIGNHSQDPLHFHSKYSIMDHIPTDAPPSYDEAAGSSNRPTNTNTNTSVPHKVRNGIPPQSRRSMEDEGRPLPHGWIRQYDPQNHHQFFVDTDVEPPRSIWCHPYDDEQYMNGLDPKERQKIKGSLRVPSQADIAAESSDDDGDHHHHHHPQQTGTGAAELPPRDPNPPTGVTKFGRKMKDKMTHTTHEQREQERIRRAEEERRAYQRHQELRQAMSRAVQTGEPQYVGKGRDGKDIYIEPPQGMGPPRGGYGYNPYTQGPYANPNATFIRPQYPCKSSVQSHCFPSRHSWGRAGGLISSP